MALSDYLISSSFDKNANTSANLLSGTIAPIQLSVSKQNLDITKQLFYLFQDTHAKEEIRDNRRDELFLELLDEIKKLNENIKNMGGVK